MSDIKDNKIEVEWHEVDKILSDLKTNHKHTIEVKREAIPIVFVPGVMGSVLRRAGSQYSTDDVVGDRVDAGLPNKRWSTNVTYLAPNYSNEPAAHRRRMLVGIGRAKFDNNYLIVDEQDPVGNGFSGVCENEYHSFLKYLQKPGLFRPLNKFFELPVYAVGYNWTASNKDSGEKLHKRIKEIIAEARSVTGKCEKVIVITHSMGGLVSRHASEVAGAQSNILGIIHGVQPVTGAATAFWRIKAGFEGNFIASNILGPSARSVTPILGSLPGGLQLLPNKHYRDNNGNKEWLTVTENGKITKLLPKSNVYDDIYRIKGTNDEWTNGKRKYWGLVDPDLLDPAGNPVPGNDPNDRNSLANDAHFENVWEAYLKLLKQAEVFHDTLGVGAHPNTYTFHGIYRGAFGGVHRNTCDHVYFKVTKDFKKWKQYEKRTFKARFRVTDPTGNPGRLAVMQASGDNNDTGVMATGDGTVPVSSATALDRGAQQIPAPADFDTEHVPAYKSDDARKFVVQAIIAICAKRYEEKRGKKIVK